MKKLQATVIALTLGGVLAGSGMYAFAENAKKSDAKPFEGIVVEDVIVMEQLPTEVQSGSIKVGDANEQAMAKLAKLDAANALQIAAQAAPGKVIELQLDEENGFLIWEVTQMTPKGEELQLKLDAGDGRLLAAELGDADHNDADDRDEGKHSSWKFWEDNDKDEKAGDRD
ncbi:MAG: PepSY domain-containing protein [Sedimenticolaceae bacterium]|jgi:uncharacterized membrane protein YkoI